ncbi:MAG: hypothetical protein ACJZ8O_10555 [Pirellulaceae bacterium]
MAKDKQQRLRQQRTLATAQRNKAGSTSSESDTPKPKKTRRRKKVDPAVERMRGEESRGAETVTVLWSITILATLASLLGALGFEIFAGMTEDEEMKTNIMGMRSWFLAVACIAGFAGFFLSFAMYHTRKYKPPVSVMWIGVLISTTAFLLGIFIQGG